MDLNNLRRKQDFLQHDAPPWCRTFWPRIEALNHFIKQHKTRLAEAGAAVFVGREWFVDVDRFPAVAAEILGLPADAA